MALVVEQMLNDGKLENGLDNSLFPSQLNELLKKDLPYQIKKEKNQHTIQNKIALLVKNVTYLGNPHPLYKKRIQMSTYYPQYIRDNEMNGMKTLIVGVYSYTEETIYVVYNVSSYINNKFNNSSAHVMTSDLFDVRINGYSMKIDKGGNEILLFNKTKFKEYIDSLLNDNKIEYIEKERSLIKYITEYWASFPKHLDGIECYNEMVKDNFSNAYQAEWIGFYNEFLFNKYLINNPTNLIEIHNDKKSNGIDLDLKMNIDNNFFGDLKMHSIDGNILGNKLETIQKVLNVNGRIWYITGSFTAAKDKESGYVVTEHWRHLKEEFNETCESQYNMKSVKEGSYGNKMKKSVDVKEFHILDITSDKISFIKQYDQGKNSNGKERLPKITISKNDIEHLSICHIKIKKD